MEGEDIMSAEGLAVDDTASQNAALAKQRRIAALAPHKFQPGQSGNPGGRTPLQFECQRIAREMCPEALERAAEIMRQTEDERAALVAVGIILDRGLGKPKEIKQEDQRVSPDLSRLTPADLATLRRIMLVMAQDGMEVLKAQAMPANQSDAA